MDSYMAMMGYRELDISHHGIKGQRWGVQNGPPYPLDKKTVKAVQKQQKLYNREANKGVRNQRYRDEHVVPAGTMIYRTTVNKDEPLHDSMYVSYLDVDRDTYRGGWVRKNNGASVAYEKSYMLKKPLRVPSRKESADIVKKVMDDNPDLYMPMAKTYVNNFIRNIGLFTYTEIITQDPGLSGSIGERHKQYVNKTVEDLKNRTADELYLSAVQSFGENSNIRETVIDVLKKKGYNAITDEAAVGGRNGYIREGVDPLIIFDGKSVLQDVGVKMISAKDEKKYGHQSQRYRARANANKSAEWSATHIGSGYLQHHGIKGQKWGVRRFQNADRTWTEAGKIRYGRKKSGLDSDVPKGANTVTVKKKTIFGEKVITLDHDSNSKSPLRAYAINVALSIISLNPEVIARTAIRGAKAVNGFYKSNKFEQERNLNPVDKKTGFHLKTKELSPKDDIKRVNPDVNDFNTNSKSNCVLCTMTTEMRRRGYDVTANKAGYGYLDRELTRFFPNYTVKKYGAAQGLDNAKAVYGVNKKFAKDIVSQIEKDQPEGSRGNISVQWGTGGGHSMFYEIKNGKLIISDGQIGKIYSDPVKVLKNCRSIDIGRLDNLEFDPNGIKEACR